MKKIPFLFVVLVGLIWSCDSLAETDITVPPQAENPENTPETEVPITPEEYANDIRLTAFGDSESAKWVRYPTKSRSTMYNIAYGDPAAAFCTEPGWAYIFYNDGAVIGYAPFPGRIDLMQYAVKQTVESHNLEKPNEEWGYINVPNVVHSPITKFDPVLGKWQFALCVDTGDVVSGPYTAEFDWEWKMWKEGVAYQAWEVYNIEHDPDAHIVWGTEK